MTEQPTSDESPADESPADGPTPEEPAPEEQPTPDGPTPEEPTPAAALPPAAPPPAAQPVQAAIAPTAPAAEPIDAERPAPTRRRLRAVLRWTSAVVLFAAVGTATAYAVTIPPRTEIPGLATPSDGRYTFPQLDLPALPPASASASPGTGDSSDDGSVGIVHTADLRDLLLPLPQGATADRSFPGTGGWFPIATYTKLGVSAASLDENGLRNIAARAWTMPDGTRTEIYLLHFRSHYGAASSFGYDTSSFTMAKAPQAQIEMADLSEVKTIDSVQEKSQPAGNGEQAVRYAFVSTGDVEALVMMSNPKAVPDTPFQQVVILQSQLLA